MRTVFFCTLTLVIFGCARPGNLSVTQPSTATQPMLDIQGHRGARGLLPENTIPSFEKALDLGVTTLEMDVVITKDRQVVLSHEPWFSGAICSKPNGDPIPHDNEKSYKIYELTYEEVTAFDCGLRGNPRFPRQEKMAVHKPLLKDVIAFAEAYKRQPGQPAILYNIETKSTPTGDNVFHPSPETFTSLLIEVLEANNVLDRATIQSFDPRTLQVAHKAQPNMSLALLVESHDRLDFAGHLENLGFTPAIYSPYYKLVDKALLDAAHAKGMLVIPWTINTLAEMQELVALGVDGIITDYPDISRQLVETP